jgi:hypothetical protein
VSTRAQLAYEGYVAFTGDLTFVGMVRPSWDELPQRIQNAWMAAITASDTGPVLEGGGLPPPDGLY